MSLEFFNSAKGTTCTQYKGYFEAVDFFFSSVLKFLGHCDYIVMVTMLNIYLAIRPVFPSKNLKNLDLF